MIASLLAAVAVATAAPAPAPPKVTAEAVPLVLPPQELSVVVNALYDAPMRQAEPAMMDIRRQVEAWKRQLAVQDQPPAPAVAAPAKK